MVNKSKIKMQTAKRLMRYVTGIYRVQFVIVVIAIIISALANLAGPLSLMYILDDIVIPLIGSQNPDFSGLTIAVTMLAAMEVTGVVCTYIYNRLMVNIGQGVLKRVRDDMFEHMQNLPVSYFDKRANGDIMSLYTNDADALRQMLSQSIPMGFSSLVSAVVTFTAMVSINVPLSILAVAMVVVMFAVTKRISRKSSHFFAEQQLDIARVTGFVEEHMAGQKVIKVFNHEEQTKAEFDKINDELCHSADNANKYANIMMPVIGNLGNLQYVLTAMIGGILAILGIGGVTVGVMASYTQFAKSFTQPFSQMSNQLNAIIMALAGADRIFDMLDEEPEEDNGTVTLKRVKIDDEGNMVPCSERTGIWAWSIPDDKGGFNLKRMTGDVRFFDMSFGYDENKTVLHDISLFAKPGQKLAFVGSTGAGKTTITNLINRFYEVSEGRIEYDGIDVRDIKKASLRKSLGMVLQDTHLFSGTIMENIRYGKLEATDEEVYAAARLANADKFIELLPNGYDTQLTSDGEELSQGQRQLLAIARAAIANPPVLILDEATSSIDTRTESIVQKGMDELMKGRTVFVIAHRLSTIRNSEAIMVLEHGRIIERGEHEDLIKQKGTYYQLYTGALELD